MKNRCFLDLKFTKLDTIVELIPITNIESIELKAEYLKFEECQRKDRTETVGFSAELKEFK